MIFFYVCVYVWIYAKECKRKLTRIIQVLHEINLQGYEQKGMEIKKKRK